MNMKHNNALAIAAGSVTIPELPGKTLVAAKLAIRPTANSCLRFAEFIGKRICTLSEESMTLLSAFLRINETDAVVAEDGTYYTIAGPHDWVSLCEARPQAFV
jgi:hypothetical protein